MKKFYWILAFLFAVVGTFLSASVSMATVHHTDVNMRIHSSAYTPGTAYYSFSSLATTGPVTGTIGASNLTGGLTLYIAADGTFAGTLVGSPTASLPAGGSFQSDGSLQLTVLFRPSLTTYLNATLSPQRGGRYTGTYAVTQTGGVASTGVLALAPVMNPQSVIAIRVGALITSGPDQAALYSGVIILDQSGSHGTVRLQDGRILPVIAQISQSQITFTVLLGPFKVDATGIPSTVGVVTTYTGTFTGPKSSDSGNWRGTLFQFVL